MAGSQQDTSRSAGGPAPSGAAPHDSHGNSIAAWACVSTVMFASVVMGLAVVFPNVALFVVGALLVVVALILGKVLSVMGFGSAGKAGH